MPEIKDFYDEEKIPETETSIKFIKEKCETIGEVKRLDFSIVEESVKEVQNE